MRSTMTEVPDEVPAGPRVWAHAFFATTTEVKPDVGGASLCEAGRSSTEHFHDRLVIGRQGTDQIQHLR